MRRLTFLGQPLCPDANVLRVNREGLKHKRHWVISATASFFTIAPTLTDRPGQYVFFMITRTNYYAKIELDNVINCVCALKEVCLGRDIRLLIFPIIDPGCGWMRLLNLFMLLACVFADTDMMILLHDRYYISTQEEEPIGPDKSL